MKRGQAALEYLVTYGWGFLAILVVLGALAYFGFLNPTRYLPSRCAFGSQFECRDHLLAAPDDPLSNHGCVLVKLTNNFGDDVVIESVFAEGALATITNVSTCSGGKPPGAGPPITVLRGATEIVRVHLPTSTKQVLVEEDRMLVPLTVEFHRLDASSTPPRHNITGEIYTAVQAWT